MSKESGGGMGNVVGVAQSQIEMERLTFFCSEKRNGWNATL